MVTFKEYYQGDKIMSATVTSLTDPGGNGKSIMRTGRKHENLKRREHRHKCSEVDSIVNGSTRQTQLTGQPLLNALAEYGVQFSAGQTKGLGNSGVEVKMFEDREGNQCGMLIKKQ